MKSREFKNRPMLKGGRPAASNAEPGRAGRKAGGIARAEDGFLAGAWMDGGAE
jgi:hypothetical protein